MLLMLRQWSWRSITTVGVPVLSRAIGTVPVGQPWAYPRRTKRTSTALSLQGSIAMLFLAGWPHILVVAGQVVFRPEGTRWDTRQQWKSYSTVKSQRGSLSSGARRSTIATTTRTRI